MTKAKIKIEVVGQYVRPALRSQMILFIKWWEKKLKEDNIKNKNKYKDKDKSFEAIIK